MKSIKRILATALMLAMVFTLLGGTFSVSAASAVTCTSSTIVVDDDFADAAKGEKVSATVAGTVYSGVLGKTAFATIQEAYAALDTNGSLYVAAGVYAGALSLDKAFAMYGNMKDVNPNNTNDLSKASGNRAATGHNETILQDMQIFYTPKGATEVLSGSYAVTINGFAIAGDSCIRLQDDRLANARVNISYNVFDLVNENAYSNIGINDDSFSAVLIGQMPGYNYVSAEAEIAHNRIEKVSSTGSGLATTNGISVSWITDLNMEGNYIANVTGAGFSVSETVTTTKVVDNYVKNAGLTRVYGYMRGAVEISGNTLDTVGGTTAGGQYALGVYADANTNVYATTWPTDTQSVLIINNTFKNLGKAIRLYGRLRESDAPINSSPYGAQIYDNTFVPASTQDCTFIHMSYSDGVYAPPVYHNYTGGLNPKDICIIDSSDAGASIDFGEYWLNEEMTDSSALLDVTAITNNAGVSFATADIQTAPDCSVSAFIPAALSQIKIGLEVNEGAYYELYSDAACTTLLPNDTVQLKEGQISYAYAEVHYNDYSIVYTIILTRKIAYSDYLDASECVVGPEFAQYPSGQTVYVEIGDEWRRAVVGHSAFSDLPLALDKAQAGDVINMTAGRYENAFAIEGKGVTIRGAKAGINPNDMNSSEYTRSEERSGLNTETLICNEITLKQGINGLTFDGVTFTEKGRMPFSGSFGVDGLTFKNVMTTASTGTDALLQRGRDDAGKNTLSNILFYQCRFEGAGTSYLMRLPNISSGGFERTVFYQCGKNIYMGGTDGTSSDVMFFKDNIFYGVTVGNFIYVGQTASADGTNSGSKVLNSILLDGNRFINCTASLMLRIDRWRAGNRLIVTNNRFEGTTKSGISVNPEAGYAGQSIVMNNNYFGSSMGIVLITNLDNVADCSYNYFANGAAASISGSAKYVPYYIDAEMTQLAGAFDITSVKTPATAALDTEAKSVTYTATAAADQLTFDFEVSEGASYQMYSDAACENELKNNTLNLVGAYTEAYVKVTAEDGETYNVYTVAVNQPVNTKAELLGMNIEGSTWVDQGTKYNCVLPNSYVKGPILPLTSAGATVSVYAADDTELTAPINYNTDINIPVGKTTYIIKVVSEDGNNESVYEVSFTRGKSTVCDLLEIKGSKKATEIDGQVAKGVFANDVVSLLPELTVSDGASYELFTDIGCNISLSKAVALNVGENKVYAKVTAEDGETYQLYTVILEREDKSSEKAILADSFPAYATTQDEITNDATGTLVGLKRIDNNAQAIYLKPNAYIDSIQDELVVSEGATYEIFKKYDDETGVLSGKVSSNSEQKVIKLAEGENQFYIRINALNSSAAIYSFKIYNVTKNTESNIISVNGFGLKRSGNVIIGTASNDNPQIDIFVSDNATVKVYADRKKTMEVASSMTSYTVTETQKTYTDCKLTNPMAQAYLVLYVDVTAQAGGTSSYVLKLTSSMFSNTFTDISSHWAESYIVQAYQMGVTNGSVHADGTYTFDPKDNATREQVAVFICNLLGVDTASYSKGALPYADAKSISSWSRNAVRAVTALDIMGGDGKNFNPKANISRQEFMTVMVRAAALDTSKGKTSVLNRFKDKSKVASWAKTYVATAVTYGLVNGDEKGCLNPTASITRAEIVKIMVCAKNYVR